MASYNRVILMGNLCADPELKQAPTGTPVCDLAIAINESYRNPQTNELHETVHFVDVTVWDRDATNCQTYLKKGHPVLVEGRLQQDKWKTPQGENRSKLRVRAERIRFLNPRPSTADVPGGSGAPAYVTAAATPTPASNAQPVGTAAPVANPAAFAPPPAPPAELTVDTEDLPF